MELWSEIASSACLLILSLLLRSPAIFICASWVNFLHPLSGDTPRSFSPVNSLLLLPRVTINLICLVNLKPSRSDTPHYERSGHVYVRASVLVSVLLRWSLPGGGSVLLSSGSLPTPWNIVLFVKELLLPTPALANVVTNPITLKSRSQRRYLIC